MTIETEHKVAIFGIAWDLDGVVVDTTEMHYRAWAALLEKYGMQLSWEEFIPTFGSRNRDVIPRLWAIHGRSVTPDEVERLSEEKERLFRDLLPAWVPMLPGVYELMQSAQAAGARQAIATSTPRVNLDAILKRLPPLPITATVTGDEVEHGKPAPNIFLRAAYDLGVAYERMVVIEDAPQGVKAAHAAHMACLAVATTRSVDELTRAGADRVVTTLVGLSADDLRALVQR